MYARLWWKDVRQFWPIWAFLVLSAVGAEAVAVWYGGPGVRTGALPLAAVGWACLYAFAVGAAAFAGERESGTLALLDALPVARRVLWGGKVSFAVVSTLGLAVVLAVAAAAGTRHWDASQFGPPTRLVAVGGALLLQALGWGLLWSAWSRSALGAALWAIASATVTYVVTWAWFLGVWGGDTGARAVSMLAVAAVTTAVSALVVTRPSWAGGRRTVDEPGPRWRLRSPLVIVPRPEAAIAAVAPADDEGRSARRPWVPEVRALLWQTDREGVGTWRNLFLIGVVVPAALMLLSGGDPSFSILFGGLVGLIAGVNVFHLETRGGTQRFLAHHGARPGLVWGAKVAVWSAGLVLLWAGLVAVTLWLGYSRWNNALSAAAVGGVGLVQCAAAGLLCGMTIRRGITAGVVALVLALALIVPQSFLVSQMMLSPLGLAAAPLGLLFVTWGWRSDWLLDRPAPGRWVRLALLLVGTSAVLGSGYAALRAWGVPDAPSVAPPAAWSSPPAGADANAADLYREAARKVLVYPSPDATEVLHAIEFGFDPDERITAAVLSENAEALAATLRASARPSCRFVQPETVTLFSGVDLPPVTTLANLVALDARSRQQRGDLAGAWDDIVALFRISRHLGEGAVLAQANQAGAVEQMALGLARAWAVDPKQTPRGLRDALASYRGLPAPSAADVVRAEARLAEKALELPPARLREEVLTTLNDPRSDVRASQVLWADLITTPWERTRARRVFRVLTDALVGEARVDPSRRRPVLSQTIPSYTNALRNLGMPWYDYLLASTPLARTLLPNFTAYQANDDRRETDRRALPLVMALQVWRLEHNGRYPDRLEELVPGLLPMVPKDPFAEAPFRYTRSEGQLLPSPDRVVLNPLSDTPAHLKPSRSQRLVYSVGPDRQDNRGSAVGVNAFGNASQWSDLVYPLPDEEGGPDDK